MLHVYRKAAWKFFLAESKTILHIYILWLAIILKTAPMGQASPQKEISPHYSFCVFFILCNYFLLIKYLIQQTWFNNSLLPAKHHCNQFLQHHQLLIFNKVKHIAFLSLYSFSMTNFVAFNHVQRNYHISPHAKLSSQVVMGFILS